MANYEAAWAYVNALENPRKRAYAQAWLRYVQRAGPFPTPSRSRSQPTSNAKMLGYDGLEATEMRDVRERFPSFGLYPPDRNLVGRRVMAKKTRTLRDMLAEPKWVAARDAFQAEFLVVHDPGMRDAAREDLMDLPLATPVGRDLVRTLNAAHVLAGYVSAALGEGPEWRQVWESATKACMTFYYG